MPTNPQMKAVLQSYLDHFNSGDVEALTALFADDAVVEDPVGQPPKRGKKEIIEFYKYALGTGSKVRLVAPIRGSQGSSAAMAFQAVLGGMTMNIVDVMDFNEAGKIVSMKAYWSMDDVEQAAK